MRADADGDGHTLCTSPVYAYLSRLQRQLPVGMVGCVGKMLERLGRLNVLEDMLWSSLQPTVSHIRHASTNMLLATPMWWMNCRPRIFDLHRTVRKSGYHKSSLLLYNTGNPIWSGALNQCVKDDLPMTLRFPSALRRVSASTSPLGEAASRMLDWLPSGQNGTKRC